LIRIAKNLVINRTTSADGEKAGDVDGRELPDSSYAGRFPPVVVKRVREFLSVLRTDSNAHPPYFRPKGFDEKPIRAGSYCRCTP